MEWCIRARHELIENKKAVYLTMTYAPGHLPRNLKTKPENENDKCGTLKPHDVTNYIKKIRKKFPDTKIRYIYSGEYGPYSWRPHYHMILFGINWEECIIHLKNLWPWGHVDVSTEYVTDWAMNYVVGYLRKKITFSEGEKHYELNYRIKPYMRTSQGIGGEWAIKNINDWAHDCCVAYNGSRFPVPRYYINKVKKMEGRTVQYDDKKILSDIICKITKSYLVIENPKGKWTQIINNALDKQKAMAIDSFDKYRLPEKKIKAIKGEYEIRNYMQKAEQKQRINLLNNMSDKEIKNEYDRTTDVTNFTGQKSHSSNPSIEDNETKQYLSGIAQRKELEYIRSPFGKRDKLDILTFKEVND